MQQHKILTQTEIPTQNLTSGVHQPLNRRPQLEKKLEIQHPGLTLTEEELIKEEALGVELRGFWK